MLRRNAPALKVLRGGKSELAATNDSFDDVAHPLLEFPGPSRQGAPDSQPPQQPASPPPGSEEKRGRFRLPLLLSILVHAALFACLIFAPRPKPAPEAPKQVVIELELAAQGLPEAPEAPPAPPPPQAQPAPPPPAQAAPPPEPQPPAPPEVQKAPEPPPAPEAEPVPLPPPVTVAPEPKPEPPQPKAEVPPEPAPQPRPQPEPPPVAVAPPQPAPAAPPQPAPAPTAPPAPRKGIETGVSSGTSQAEMNRYITTLFTMIDAKKVYPSQSLQRREQGTVVVRLSIAADGKLLDVTSPTEKPERLVEASLDAVKRAAPFPPLPASLKKSEAEFEVPVVYKLQ